MIEFLKPALYVVSGAAWSVAYLLIIVRGHKDKTYGMPFLPLAFNIAWEFCFTTVFSDGDPIHRVVNGSWLILDLGILVTYLRYGMRDWPATISKKLFYPYSLFVMMMAFAIIWFATRELHDSNGGYMAFIQNLMMSLLFINMLNQRGNLSGQSAAIAICKMIGTLAPTLLFVLLRVKFIAFTGAMIFFFDFVYFVMVLNKGRLFQPIRLRLRA